MAVMDSERVFDEFQALTESGYRKVSGLLRKWQIKFCLENLFLLIKICLYCIESIVWLVLIRHAFLQKIIFRKDYIGNWSVNKI